MELEKVTIDLGHGDQAVVYKDVLRVTARLHEAELKKHMTPVEVGNDGKVLLSKLEEVDTTSPKLDYLVDLRSIDDDTVNEIYILHQVVSWTLGSVDLETLNNKMTNEQYKKLVKEMDKLYKPVPLASAAPDAKP